MQVNGTTRLSELVKAFPGLIAKAKALDPRLEALDSLPGRLFIKKATVADLAKKAGQPEADTIRVIQELIGQS